MIIRTLLACAFSNTSEEMPAPQYPTFNLNDDAPVHSSLEQALRSCCQQSVKRPSGFTKGSAQDVQCRNDLRSAYDKDLSIQIKLCPDSPVSQWPCLSPLLPPKNLIALISRDSALHKCNELYAEWYKNYQFKLHKKEVQGILAGIWCQENRVRRLENRIIEAQSEFLQKRPPSLSSLFGTFKAPILGDCPPPLTCKRNSGPNAYHGDYELWIQLSQTWRAVENWETSERELQQNGKVDLDRRLASHDVLYSFLKTPCVNLTCDQAIYRRDSVFRHLFLGFLKAP